jgi:hypothetical protein
VILPPLVFPADTISQNLTVTSHSFHSSFFRKKVKLIDSKRRRVYYARLYKEFKFIELSLLLVFPGPKCQSNADVEISSSSKFASFEIILRLIFRRLFLIFPVKKNSKTNYIFKFPNSKLDFFPRKVLEG